MLMGGTARDGGDEGGSRDRGEAAAPPEPGLLVSQIRRYKANKEVMEKAAEVYTRLKSRVLGPKIEAIQKATKTGSEKERAEAEKAEEVLAGEEAPTERAEDEASTGEELEDQGGQQGPEHGPVLPPDCLGTRYIGTGCAGSLCPQGGWRLGHTPLCCSQAPPSESGSLGGHVCAAKCARVTGAGGHGGLGRGRATVSQEEQGPWLLGQEGVPSGGGGVTWSC